jgi:uncharacterized membrane protein
MTTTIIAGVIFIAGLCLGILVFLYLAYFKKNTELSAAGEAKANTPVKTELAFEWKYVTLPVIIFITSIIIAAMFFFQLPDEIAYRFTSGGAAESWMGRITITAIMLGLQFVIIAMVVLIIRTIIGFAKTIEQSSPGFNPDRFMLLIGNIAALPQLVLAVIMFDIFSFNVVNKHVLSIWLLILIMAISGAIILSVFFIRAFINTRNRNK